MLNPKKSYFVENETPNEISNDVLKVPKGFGKRHIQAILCFLGITATFAFKSNISVSIVAMTDKTTNSLMETYDWSPQIRSYIVSSLFLGYIPSPLLSSIIINRFSVKLLFFLTTLITSILTILIPMCASFGWQYICLNRALQGVTQGFTFPCVYALLSKWVHPYERSTLIGIAFGGCPLGIVIVMAISGPIAVSNFGWPGIFYICGGYGVLCAILIGWLGCNSPAEHQTILKEERDFIESMPGNSSVKKSIPWMKIFKSKPFLALLLCQCAQNWGFTILLSMIPTYMASIFNFDINSNSFYSTLPFLLMLILNCIIPRIADMLIKQKRISILFSRKFFNTLGLCIPGICLIVLGNINVTLFAAISLLTLGVGSNAAIHSGFIISHVDITPNFSGVTMGICYSVGNVLSVLSPVFVGFVVTDLENYHQWNFPFSLIGCLFIFSNIIYLIYIKANVLKWN